MSDQQELFKAETQWFHVFKTMVDSGDVAKLGPHAVAVYLVIKAHTNFSTGRAFPAIDTIEEKSGVSRRQVLRSLEALVEHGYLTVEKKGRNNHYTLREKVEIHDGSGRPSAVATWDYLPSGVQAAVADLKNVLVTGDAGSARVVHIEKLVINVAQAGGVVVNVDAASVASEEGRKRVQEMVGGVVSHVTGKGAGSVDKTK